MSDPDADLDVGYLPPQLSRDDAIGILRRRRLQRLRRLVFRQPVPQVRSSDVHLIWMPQFLIDLQIESDRGQAIQRVTLDGWCEVFALWNIETQPEKGLPAGEFFPPRIDVDEGVRKAIVSLTNTTLRMRGQRNKPHVLGHAATELLYYPYWVYYFERKKGRFDVKIVDGVLGELPGSQVKRAVLEAFIEKSRTQMLRENQL